MVPCRLARKAKFLTLVMLTMVFDVAPAIHHRTWASELDSPKPVQEIDEKCMIGRWVRPDGEYVLELSVTGTKGKLKAAYFNPRPIHVSRAEVACKEGNCTVFVESRDVNYPGSKYNLRYDKKTDRLIGRYFEAVAGETYAVEFLRIK